MLILLAEDDVEDRALIQQAIGRAADDVQVEVVQDGVHLLERLREPPGGRQGLPALVLLDLNMPRMDGREALALIRETPDLRRLVVVVLTTSDAPRDITFAYDTGANSFITKPDTFDELVRTMDALQRYWRTVTLPPT